MDSQAKELLNREYEKLFDDIYDQLRTRFSTPLEWTHYMLPPRRWWHFGYKKRHVEVKKVFAQNGFYLTKTIAEYYLFHTDHQRPDEDCGGSVVRRLRQTFQYQLGVPYSYLPGPGS